ncbi:MAG: bifunctional riboflavin kinase/FAD synthetase [Candidatus Omnitrophota bacterium]
MKTIFIHSQKRLQKFKNPVVAIGIFDGIHRGHQVLIKKTIARAKKINGTSIVLTFFPHPVQVLNKHFDLSLLVSLPHRLRLIEEMGIDVCVVVRFTRRFATMTAEDFVKKYLSRLLGAHEVVIGRNFHFGKNRNGNSELLRAASGRYDIKVHALKSVCYQKSIISSSLLRSLIKGGDLSLARKYLGRFVSISGYVVHGDQRGRRLGVPTANINQGQEILPPTGVYIVDVFCLGKLWQGVANIGYRPSFKRNKKRNIEVHIFNFNKNIYGKGIEIRFLKRIRDEKRFLLPEHLCDQIELDKSEARKYFSRNKKHQT